MAIRTIEKALFYLFTVSALGVGLWYAIPQLQLYREYQPLITSLEQAKNHTYQPGYQCVEFSKDLAQKLQEQGIEAQIQIVQVPGEENYHAVVSLQIEPQTGQLVHHELIDTCQLVNNELTCEQGVMTSDDKYVASNK